MRSPAASASTIKKGLHDKNIKHAHATVLPAGVRDPAPGWWGLGVDHATPLDHQNVHRNVSYAARACLLPRAEARYGTESASTEPPSAACHSQRAPSVAACLPLVITPSSCQEGGASPSAQAHVKTAATPQRRFGAAVRSSSLWEVSGSTTWFGFRVRVRVRVRVVRVRVRVRVSVRVRVRVRVRLGLGLGLG